MVRIGFIVEGDSEMIFIGSNMFREWCLNNGIDIVDPIINARGGGNLLPQYLPQHIAGVSQNGKPDIIVILTDLEESTSVEEVRQRILTEEFKNKIDVVFVSVKAFEAWLLADGVAMASWLEEETFYENSPENTPDMPFAHIKQVAKNKNKRGPGSSKPSFTMKMLNKHGFSLERAAQHPNCPRVREFHDTLKQWGEDCQ